jgi:stage II sporulation protein D
MEPELRVGLVQGASRARISAEHEVTVLGASGSPIPEAPSSAAWTVIPEPRSVVLVSSDGWRSSPMTEVSFAPTSPGVSVSLNDRPYRGRLVAIRDRTGLTVVNRVGLESYLAGVVSAEMGRRDSTDQEALAAQAIVSRTFALRNLGKRRQEGFDFYATVVDQVYGGIGSETPLAWRAVRETAGRILTYHGAPIDAFFYSTCGGRTADGTEVFAGAGRSYLKSVSDLGAGGQAYCSISPRFRWREQWTAEDLLAILRRTLPGAAGTAPETISDLRSVLVTRRTGSDRVAEIVIQFGQGEVRVAGPAIRQVLKPSPDQVLRSASFTLTEERRDDRLVRLVVDGSGAGHGVGFCQWGAVGRARAGQGYAEILAAYFVRTDLDRVY